MEVSKLYAIPTPCEFEERLTREQNRRAETLEGDHADLFRDPGEDRQPRTSSKTLKDLAESERHPRPTKTAVTVPIQNCRVMIGGKTPHASFKRAEERKRRVDGQLRARAGLREKGDSERELRRNRF